MSDGEKRKAPRRVIAANLREFHRLLLAQFSPGKEEFLRRVELLSIKCPACGGPMALSRSVPSFDPRAPDQVFVCAKCGVSYFTNNHIPVSGGRPI